MNNKKILAFCSASLVAGAVIGAVAMYSIQRKNIKFAKDYSALPEVIKVLDDEGIEVPDGSDKEKAVVNGYLSLYDDKYTYYYKDVDVELVTEVAGENGEVKYVDNMTTELKNGNILYTRLHMFDVDTEIVWNDLVDSDIKKAKGFILDLRDNGGGSDSTAESIADKFLKKGYCTDHLKNGETEESRMTDNGKEYDIPVVLLVNDGTASAAEEFTALMMQNYENLTVIGEKTYGKGIFQNERVLSNGGTLRYTNGYYTVGDWECYQDIGIEPDETIEMDKSLIGTFGDTQLKRALEILG